MRSTRLFFLLLTSAMSVQAGEPVHFTTPSEEPSKAYDVSTAYMTALCGEAKLQCELESVPLLRSADEMKHGATDVDLARVENAADLYGVQGDFRRLDVPMTTLGIVIYTPAQAPPVESWADLAAIPRKVGYRRGSIYIGQRFRELGEAVSPVPLAADTPCIQMLTTGRLDACVSYVELEDRPTTAQVELRAIQRSREIDRIKLYAFVNLRRKWIVRAPERRRAPPPGQSGPLI